MLPPATASYPLNVPDVLIATDSPSVYADIRSAIQEPGVVLRWTRSGRAVVPGLLERPADLVVSDLQIGSMGGYSIAMDIALEAGAGRISPVPVLLLLDRRADVFLARRTAVAGWLLKPLDLMRTRAAVQALLAGEGYQDPTFAPVPADVLPG